MALTTFLNNTLVVTLNSVDVSDQVTAATINQTFDELETTTMGGNGSHTFVKGLESSTVTLDFLNSYAASEVATTLQSAYGTTVALTIKPTSAAISATNPEFQTTILVNNLTPVSGSVGDLSTQSITFTCNSPIVVDTTA
jgi:hypothetical protein